MPRIIDPKLVPSVPPSEVSRLILGKLGDKIASDSGDVIALIAGHFAALAEEAHAGRMEGVIACGTDLRIAIDGANALIAEAMRSVDAVSRVDPPYAMSLLSFLDAEIARQSAFDMRRHGVKPAHFAQLRAEHTKAGCCDPKCPVMRAIDQAEQAMQGGC